MREKDLFFFYSSSLTAVLMVVFVIVLVVVVPVADGLGSMSMLAVAYGTDTVCGILRGNSKPQTISCVVNETSVAIAVPEVSFDGIAGGRDFLCGLRSGGSQLFCWDTAAIALSAILGNASHKVVLKPRRVYNNSTAPLAEVAVGEGHVCGIKARTGVARCWRPLHLLLSLSTVGLRSITAGRGFSCGISAADDRRVICWGIPGDKATGRLADAIESGFVNADSGLASLVAGESHVCGITAQGTVVCHGNNDSGQLNAPPPHALGFSGIALGRNWTCAIRRSNGTVVCWGGGMSGGNYPSNTAFEFLVSGKDFACGLTTSNFSVLCWGQNRFNPARILSQGGVVPGRCTPPRECLCGAYPGSEYLCFDSRLICEPCRHEFHPPPVVLLASPPPPSTYNITENKALIAFALIGYIGVLSGIATTAYCVWSGICCCKRQKIHNSVRPRMGNGGGGGTTTSPTRPSMGRLQSSRMRRQRSGTSSTKPVHCGAQEFSLRELSVATNGFPLESRIGSGSFGTVYRGKLADGREVAIKRGEICPKKKFQEKETAFQSELVFLSRLHHKHLVPLVGFCEELEEKLLVYEFMQNGALHDHLHKKNDADSPINSWQVRIRIALDAARGIEYLHNYAVPPIIHRDIKSSNILLDAGWMAKVSDLGLSLKGPDAEGGCLNLIAAGTVGYMDPEYYQLQHLTTKSDVYGFGVVMLEILTGKRAVHKDEETGTPVSVVDFVVRKIIADNLPGMLDRRVAPPQGAEAEAVELVAHVAVHCVSLEGKERPNMTDIVANLERAVSMFNESHGSISSNGISSVSL